MRSDRPRPLATFFRAIVSALLAGCLLSQSPTKADDSPAPAKKDSLAEIKPKTAVLTTSVEPAEAKPGDTVTFKVTAKLDAGFHIYKYSKTQGEGPINTSFDFFDPAGLKVDGEWTASSEPLKKKDPNFADLESVEFYEDEVTWSIKLKVPADAAAGDKTLRCQARYMVCDDKTCSIPGRWTLPEAILKIVVAGSPAPTSAAPTSKAAEPAPREAPGTTATQAAQLKIQDAAQPQGGTAQPAIAAPVPAAQPATQKITNPGSPPAPAKKDSLPEIKPKTAVLTTSVEPVEAKPGDTVTFKVTAKVDPGFHIYKYSKTQGAGPINTSFDFFDPAGLKVDGEWTASSEPLKKKDPNFADLKSVEFYEDKVSWSIKLTIPADAVAGDKILRCQARYMVCDDKTCSIPGRWTLPDATLKILAAASPAPRSAAATPGTAEPAPKEASGTTASQSPQPKNQDAAQSKFPASSQPAAAPSPVAQPAAQKTASPAQTSAPSSALAPPPSGILNAPSLAAPGSSPAEAPAAAKIQSEIAETAQAGLLPFLIASALGGLFALVMPCVWPMVPITVNFFVKQGQGKGGRSKATSLAFIYCLSIIGVFTAVGVLFSFFFSASSLQSLANNPWLNLFVAALFVMFGLSLLGLFELRLPSFLLNASAQQESRGGLIGVVFMALTLTITSFTCTFPVVGGLLVMAASGDFLYPIIGLATFATVLAFPFLLLALSPGLISRMPRSGDWMNAIKVVGGLVEIGAALKFLNTAELAYVIPEDAWFDAHLILTCWIALSLVCGLYLLGVFRTEHDHGEVKVGSIRIVSAVLFLGLAIYMMPALFGRPPKSLVWDRLIMGLLPPDAIEFRAVEQLAGNSGDSSGSVPLRNVKATSTDPAQAEREEKKVHGVLWGMSLEQAQELAKAEKKPILIDFTGENCSNCRLMESLTLPKPEVVALLKKFVTVELYTDFVPIGSLSPDQREELATRNQLRLLKLVKDAANPIYVALGPDGQLLGRQGGYIPPDAFVNFLTKALDKLPADMKVAEAVHQ